jgi:arylsulfatase A-like enzyme
VEENTLVIFSSDNGPENTGTDQADRPISSQTPTSPVSTRTTASARPAACAARKRNLFEGGVRVPFIVRWPGRSPANTRNDFTVFTAVDLLPTLCAAAGVTLPSDYRGDGENLLGALLGQPVARTRPIFWEWRGNPTEPDGWPRLAVRDGDWKLLLTSDAQRVALHRIPMDRAEAADVARDHPAVVSRLTRLALEWKATLPPQPPASGFSPASPAGTTPPTKKAGRKSSPL